MGIHESDGRSLVKVKTDLHNYLATNNVFPNGFADRALIKASAKLGQGGVLGIADVNEYRYRKIKEGVEEYSVHDLGIGFNLPALDLTVLRGERVFTSDGNILVLGLREDQHIKPGRPMRDTLKQAREEYNGIIVLSNLSTSNKSREYFLSHLEDLALVDAIEVHNGSQAMTDQNVTAQAFFEGQQATRFPALGSIVTSGGHSVYGVGSSWMMIPQLDYQTDDKLKESLRESLRIPRTKDEEHRTNSYFGAIHHKIKHYFWKQKAGRRSVDDNGIAE